MPALPLTLALASVLTAAMAGADRPALVRNLSGQSGSAQPLGVAEGPGTASGSA